MEGRKDTADAGDTLSADSRGTSLMVKTRGVPVGEDSGTKWGPP